MPCITDVLVAIHPRSAAIKHNPSFSVADAPWRLWNKDVGGR